MYRISTHEPCVTCGKPVPVQWAELDPAGRGVRCHRCVVGEQIAAHKRTARRHDQIDRGLVFAVLALLLLMFRAVL